MADHNPEDYTIKSGLDGENYYLFWPGSEWLTVVAFMGLSICFRHVLLGFFLAAIILFLFSKFRSEERGRKAHFLWRLNLLKTKKGLQWAPSAHVTRFDQ